MSQFECSELNLSEVWYLEQSFSPADLIWIVLLCGMKFLWELNFWVANFLCFVGTNFCELAFQT